MTVDQPVQYAGFWLRVLSHLVDWLLLGMVRGAITLPFIGIIGIGAFGSDLEYNPAMLFMVLLAVAAAMFFAFVTGWLYYAFMESSSKQATVGKIVVRLRVTDINYSRITFARASARYFGRILSGLLLGVGFLMAAFTQQKQTLHDIIAGTLVLKR
jgi:uncharacterized RDD family membrane protein YckC